MIIINKRVERKNTYSLPMISQLLVSGFFLSCLSYTPSALSQQDSVTKNLTTQSVSDNSSRIDAHSPVIKEKKRRVRRAQTMSTKIYKKLDKIREYVDEKKYQDAESLLESLEKRKRNPYEVAMTWNMEAYLHYNREDYKKAAASYEKIVTQDNIPESLEQTTLYSLAKLYLIQQDYSQSLIAMNRWFSLVDKPSAESHVLRAQMYYQLEQYSKALPDIKSAITITESAGKKPRENWLLIERAVYYQNKDYIAMERCLKNLIALYPTSNSIGQYWVQLAAVYNELEDIDAELAALETAYDLKLLVKESQLVNLAQVMLSKEIPFKAAQVLLYGMNNKIIKENGRNLSLLADAFMLAKENDRAIKILEKTAKLSNSVKDYYRLAQIYTERQNWPLALSNLDSALNIQQKEKKSSVEEIDLRILKGLVLFNLNDLLLAKAEFEVASQLDGKDKVISQWLRYIDAEQKRKEYLATVD